MTIMLMKHVVVVLIWKLVLRGFAVPYVITRIKINVMNCFNQNLEKKTCWIVDCSVSDKLLIYKLPYDSITMKGLKGQMLFCANYVVSS